MLNSKRFKLHIYCTVHKIPYFHLMKLTLLLLSFVPLFSSAQLKEKYIPRNTIVLNDSTFIGQTEITNQMYREFVNFVKDSMFTHLLYDSLPYSVAKKFLNAPEKTLKKLTEDKRQEYAKIYGLNYSAYKPMIEHDSLVITKTTSMYYPQTNRFYKRREIDVRKLKYTLPSGELVSVYPDTLSWANDYYVKYDPVDSAEYHYSWADDFLQYYFWHPAYDNYAVVGVNQAQILAYCHWYSRQLNASEEKSNVFYTVSIPSIYDYTEAVKICVPGVVSSTIGSENLINPIIYNRNPREASTHIHPAYQNILPSIGLKSVEEYVMREWVKINATSPILNLLGGPAEVVKPSKEPDYMTVLGGDYYLGIVDPNGIQANTLFYERLLYKEQGYSFVSFRILVKAKKMK